ncbi:hypothetical protein FRC02_006424, partial [Tulasnella sp. 418]
VPYTIAFKINRWTGVVGGGRVTTSLYPLFLSVPNVVLNTFLGYLNIQLSSGVLVVVGGKGRLTYSSLLILSSITNEGCLDILDGSIFKARMSWLGLG